MTSPKVNVRRGFTDRDRGKGFVLSALRATSRAAESKNIITNGIHAARNGSVERELLGMCQNVAHVYKANCKLGYKCIIIIAFTEQIFCYKKITMHTTVAGASRRFSGFRKFFLTFVILLVLALAGYIYWKFYYPYTSDGVKSGYLNYAVRKGQLFKTYEGKLIQEGIRSKTAGAIQSNEFEFSIRDKEVFEVLKLNSGKIFDLHYKEYNGVLPWRGNTRYIVDSIISMRDPER